MAWLNMMGLKWWNSRRSAREQARGEPSTSVMPKLRCRSATEAAMVCAAAVICCNRLQPRINADGSLVSDACCHLDQPRSVRACLPVSIPRHIDASYHGSKPTIIASTDTSGTINVAVVEQQLNGSSPAEPVHVLMCVFTYSLCRIYHQLGKPDGRMGHKMVGRQ